jgi:hypothetical protein
LRYLSTAASQAHSWPVSRGSCKPAGQLQPCTFVFWVHQLWCSAGNSNRTTCPSLCRCCD